MAIKELEARYAAKRAKDYKLADGEGLYLLVRPNGSKLWRFKYRFDGKEKLLSFGAIPTPALAPRGCAGQRQSWRSGRAGIPAPSLRQRRSRRSKLRRGRGTRTARGRLMPATPLGC